MEADTIKRLHDFLLKEESIPIRDSAKIITAFGVIAAARIGAIKDCLNLIRKEVKENKD